MESRPFLWNHPSLPVTCGKNIGGLSGDCHNPQDWTPVQNVMRAMLLKVFSWHLFRSLWSPVIQAPLSFSLLFASPFFYSSDNKRYLYKNWIRKMWPLASSFEGFEWWCIELPLACPQSELDVVCHVYVGSTLMSSSTLNLQNTLVEYSTGLRRCSYLLFWAQLNVGLQRQYLRHSWMLNDCVFIRRLLG